MKQKIEVEIEVPEGYELTGEYRPPKEGECFIRSTRRHTKKLEASSEHNTSQFILKKREPRKFTLVTFQNGGREFFEGHADYVGKHVIKVVEVLDE